MKLPDDARAPKVRSKSFRPDAETARALAPVPAAREIERLRPKALGPNSPLHGPGVRRKAAAPEHDAQVRLFQVLLPETFRYAPQLIDVYAVPNFSGALGRLPHNIGKRLGAGLNAEGRKPGVLDVVAPFLRGRYGACYVELKFGKNTLSDEQYAFAVRLREYGNAVAVVRRDTVEALAAAALDVLLKYVRLGGHPAFTEDLAQYRYAPGSRNYRPEGGR